MALMRRRREVFVWGLLALVGVLAFLPAVQTPLFLDDYLHVAMVEKTFPVERGPFDLYDFVDDGVRPELVARGLLPWWAHPKLTIRFFRPLSSALLWVDHRVFSHRALPMHLHSLAWWALAVLAVRSLYRAGSTANDGARGALSPRVATMATAIFALSRCHAMPIAWLANREALISLTLGALGLAALARWRNDRRAVDGALATGLFALALLTGGEYALCFGGYALAMELVDVRVRRSSSIAHIAHRAASLAPFAVPAVAYLVARSALGYGAVGSGFYADPLRDPVGFLRAAPWRMIALVSEGWLTLDTRDVLATPWRLGLGALVIACTAFAWRPTRRAFDALEAPSRNTVSWLLVGSLLAVLPVMGAVPSPRLLGVSAIGIAAAVAVVLDHAWFGAGSREDAGRSMERTQSLALAIGFAHLVHGPVSAWLAARELRDSASSFEEHAGWLRARLGDPARREVGIVRGAAGMWFAPFALDPRGVTPAHWYLLADMGHVLALRKGPRTLELVAPKDGALYPVGARSLFRSLDAPLVAGDIVAVPGMRVTIVESSERGPRDAVFTFDRDLDDTPDAWITEDADAWRVVRLPKPGFGVPFDP
jgi:hypothetical protein